MRHLKFRAWDSQTREMLFYGFEMFNEQGRDIYSGYKVHNGDWIELYLMQYTGLKDKNGKDIFEDDILKDHYRDKKVKVIFKNGAFLSNSENGNGFISPIEDFEVIGNIYENKELLDV